MSSKTQNQHSKLFRILSLPRELRDQIYRELLLADKVHAKEAFKYALEPAILRVNKQLYKECTRILYEENTWVLITVNWRNLQKIFPKANYPPVSHSPAGHLDAFNRKPALQVDLRDQCIETQSVQESMLSIAYHVYRVFRYVTGGHNPKQIDLSVRFDPRLSRKPEVREDLLLYLRDIRGVGKTAVTGIETTSTANELATLMMAPMKSLDELFERADAYKKRGDRQLALGNSIDGMRIYYGGGTYLNWARRCKLLTKLFEEAMQDHSSQRLTELKYRMNGLYIDSALCHIKSGRMDNALDMLYKIIACEKYLPEFQRAKAHYHCGLALLQQSKDSQALKEFTQALNAQPGHEGASEEVRKIEARTEMMDFHEN